jgi:mono/diheme cytochrome c family protein
MLPQSSVALLLVLAVFAGMPQGIDITPTVVMPSMSGRDIYGYFCASCHGPRGRGDGPVASQLKTRPANLTLLAAGNGGSFPQERVRAFVTHGRSDAPTHGSLEMPVWGPIFQALDPSDTVARTRIDNVVAYLRALQAP